MNNKFIVNLLKSIGLSAKVATLIFFAIFIALLAPLVFLWGLNLMGFEVEYSLKTLFGAFLVLFLVGGFRG